MKLKIGSKSGLKYFDIKYLRSIGPCYDPSRYLKEDFKGTAVTILSNEAIPAVDRLWVVLRTDLVSEKLMRLFAVWCARQVLVPGKSDPRSFAACDVAEAYANGLVTQEALSAAESAAGSAAWSAARSAAESAARSAAGSAARSAALSAAAGSAAWSAARSAAGSAAWSAAESAAGSAARSAAESAARSAAESAARSAQVNKLKEMVIAEAKEWHLTRKAKRKAA